MKEFERIVAEQLTLHPSMQPRDLCKLCYQAAHGGEHLLKDVAAARQYLQEEFAAVAAKGTLPLIEPISARFARVNIAPWKAEGRDVEELFALFINGKAEEDDIEEYLDVAALVWEQSGREKAELADFLAKYREAGCPSLHHSQSYREQERPAYRVIARRLLQN